MADREWLRRAEAAEYLQQNYGAYTAETLAKMACRGGGPPFVRAGRIPLYRPSDLDAWMHGRMSAVVGSTSELQAA